VCITKRSLEITVCMFLFFPLWRRQRGPTCPWPFRPLKGPGNVITHSLISSSLSLLYMNLLKMFLYFVQPASTGLFLPQAVTCQKAGKGAWYRPPGPLGQEWAGNSSPLGKWAWLATRMKPLVKAPQGAPSAEGGRGVATPPPLQEERASY